MATNIRDALNSPAARIAAAGVLIVILVTGALGVTIWPFETSATRDDQPFRSVGAITAIGAARTSTFDVSNAVLGS